LYQIGRKLAKASCRIMVYENLSRFSFCLGAHRFRQLGAISAASRHSAKR